MSNDLKNLIQARYGEAARAATAGKTASCCGPDAGAVACCDPISTDLYDGATGDAVPELALRASLGCGNPTALAELRPGETVLDLGSGGGIDVLLSARRVGPNGKVYGLDMTDEMLAVAEANRRESGLTNVEFLRGEIERIPLPDASVDVIISNCVINLSADKPRVLREAFRVLRPGGRFAVSDVVTRGPMPDGVAGNPEAWAGCLAGALPEAEYLERLADAGFERAGVEITRELDEPFASAFIRATKPSASCCGPTCCQ